MTTEKKKKKSKAAIIVLLILLFVIAGLMGGAYYYLHQVSQRTVFLQGTRLNDTDISGMAPADVTTLLLKDYADAHFSVTENNETVLTGSLADYGYTFDQDALTKSLTDLQQAEVTNPRMVLNELLNRETALTLDYSNLFDQETFQNFVKADHLSVPRVASKEAAFLYDAEKRQCYVDAAVQGNEIDDSILQNAVQEKLDALMENYSGDEGALTIAIPENAYTSPVIEDNTAELQKKCDLMNQYAAAVITHTFGEEKQTINFDTIKDWIVIDGDKASIDDAKITEYVTAMAEKYNTRHHAHAFHTTGGQDITIPAEKVEYGYTIDQEAEAKQLKEDIQSNQEVTREPVYVKTNDWGNPYYLKRNGTDDLAGTYIEADLTKQHLWYYKDGQLITESDFVSGDVSEGRETTTGLFYLAYMESPSMLEGQDYNTEVQYWMAFHEGEGLHDAVWRGSFGGNIYQTNGSHGCLNLPLSAARTIYENTQPGTPIVIYKES